MTRAYNFSAGPAMLAEPVLKQAQAELLQWQSEDMSVMEMSHRGKAFMSIAAEAEADIRQLLDIPENYKVLFLQGGASAQFAMIPMNLLSDHQSADYINTGQWSQKAIAEAERYCEGKNCSINVAAKIETSSDSQLEVRIPDFSTWELDPSAAYVHYTPNETIAGIEFNYIPDTGDVPLIADMSSNILSRKLDISKFAMIYAGAQKNIGPAGLTLVILREDMLEKLNTSSYIPATMNYLTLCNADSMYNTPPTYSWYLAGLVFKWLIAQGGLGAIEQINKNKAAKLYAAIDETDLYHSPVAKEFRSWMNVPFTLKDPSLDSAFLSQADQNSLKTLKGHKSVGGMRASIYNAMPESGVDDLIKFMLDFAEQHA